MIVHNDYYEICLKLADKPAVTRVPHNNLKYDL